MRKIVPLAIGIVLVAGLDAGVAASRPDTPSTRVTCKSTEYNPTPTQASGVVVGLTSCSKPLGDGAISATYTSTFDSTTSAGTDNGPFTKWLATGTVHGHYAGKYQFTSNDDATWDNAITVTGGTGAFRGVKGKGSETCSTTNGGATLTCTEVAELVGL